MKVIRFVAVIGILSVLSAACGGGSGTGSEDRARVTISLSPFLLNAPLHIALAEGYFEEAGLDVEKVDVTRASDALPLLGQGRLDVLSGSLSVALLNAIGRTETIKVVAGKGQIPGRDGECSPQALVADTRLLESGELRRPADLEGRRVAFNPVAFEGYIVDEVLGNAGLDTGDIEIVNLEDAVMVEALRNDAVDVVFGGEPWLTIVTGSGEADTWLAAEEVVPDFQIGVVAFGPSLLLDDPDVGRRFVEAYLRGVADYERGKTDRNVEVLAEALSLEPDLLAEACWAPFDVTGGVNWESADGFQRWALERGLIDRALEEDEFWTGEFLPS